MPEPVYISAADSYALRGWVWRRPCVSSSHPGPVVIINTATSVRCRYYMPFADYLYQQGWDAVTYDYRGIGDSRHHSLRKLKADWIDWGQHDFEGVLRYVARRFPGQPVDVVGHSAGGFVIGFAQSAHRVRRIFTMGAQYAYWRDYAPEARRSMFLRWHLAMPLLALLVGYVPAKRLGWMEDTPKGVALDWARMGPRFEHNVRRKRETPEGEPEAEMLVRGFTRVQAPILALGIDDDPFGTRPALDRLLEYYSSSERYHLRLAPTAVGQPSIGHFAFFHKRFRDVLWPLAMEWLRTGNPPTTFPGELRYRPRKETCNDN
ncbi:alpha/beta fold hydrolase [Vreelandella titanicae]|uniref:alpha/beta hydrolase family protein n=1 Tax=Vreelandella titanicae TaxID=664683 RepID=UPI001680566C|nr:alpha/beta fold hydrolase [Halomonas titanicae]QNU63254.1 alpha/beta fold hydrolase [Halomonas titanicae]